MSHEVTDKGRKALGDLIQQARNEAELSLIEFSLLIQKVASGAKISAQALNDIENANIKNISAKSLSVIARTEIVKKPSGEPYRMDELYLIACELIDPTTGNPRQTEQNGVR